MRFTRRETAIELGETTATHLHAVHPSRDTGLKADRMLPNG
jgi:hypothetical protein